MEVLKRGLRKLDVFGIAFTFRFNKKETYSTSLGGLFVILFSFAALYLGFYNLMGFIHRDNFSIVYYTMNIPVTEKIIFKDSKSAVAFGFDCTKNGRFKVEDVLDVQARFVIYSKTMEGEYVKEKNLLSTHSCTKEDFYNLYDKQFDYLSISKYKCLDNDDHIIEGIWDDQTFTYYELSVASKNKTSENLDNIEEYLFQNDCKFQFFYSDITIDLYNYEQPIAPYLNSFFIQLNPILFIKRNIFFMNQYLTDDDYIFGVIHNYDKKVETKTLFSWYEEYYLYLGLNRSITNPPNTYDYAKIYVRADTKKTDIRRNYQKLMEFYANATSLLIGIFRILVFIFNFINGFYAENFLTRKIFFLKEFEDNKHFNIFKKNKEIKELITLTDLSSIEYSEINSFETNLKDLVESKNSLNEIKTFNNQNQKYFEMKNNFRRNSFSFSKEKTESERKGNQSNNSRNNFTFLSKFLKEESKDNNKNHGKTAHIRNELNLENMVINQNRPKQEYVFNICEIIISFLCKCCMPKQLTLKNKIKTKASEIIYNKLDIVTHIRNMILIDIINEILLGRNQKNIINLISRPLLSNDKDEKIEISKFYDYYTENDFNKFYEEISELIQKTNKTERDNNLILLANKNLKEFV